MSKAEKLLTIIKRCLSFKFNYQLHNDELTIELEASDLLSNFLVLRDNQDLKFEQLMDLCGVDYLTYGLGEWRTDSGKTYGYSRALNTSNQSESSKNRFAVVYHLLSISHNQRLRVRVYVNNESLSVPSVINIWCSADWYEREAFDLFGIGFSGHPDLRRILTDYGFVGHPFRKDFPLIGELEMRYDAAAENVVYEPVSIDMPDLVPKVIRHVGLSTDEKVMG